MGGLKVLGDWQAIPELVQELKVALVVVALSDAGLQAMATGITDHIWSTAELLSYRVPAPFLDSLSELEHLFPAL